MTHIPQQVLEATIEINNCKGKFTKIKSNYSDYREAMQEVIQIEKQDFYDQSEEPIHTSRLDPTQVQKDHQKRGRQRKMQGEIENLSGRKIHAVNQFYDVRNFQDSPNKVIYETPTLPFTCLQTGSRTKYICKCGKKMTKKKKLFEHMCIHNQSNNPFECHICLKGFQKFAKLENHFEKKHRVKEDGERLFKYQLSAQDKGQKNKKKELICQQSEYKCQFEGCDKVYTSYNALYYHKMQKHKNQQKTKQVQNTTQNQQQLLDKSQQQEDIKVDNFQQIHQNYTQNNVDDSETKPFEIVEQVEEKLQKDESKEKQIQSQLALIQSPQNYCISKIMSQ